jgi:hypothetical protein
MKQRKTILKTVLWGIVGVLAGVIVERFLLKFGTTSALSGATPSWMKVVVSLGIMAVTMLVLILFVERLRLRRRESEVKSDEPEAALERSGFDPLTMRTLLPNSLAALRRYSLAAVTTAALAIALLPQAVLFGTQPEPTPVSAARTVDGFAIKGANTVDFALVINRLGDTPVSGSERLRLMIMDGNRNGRLVFFPHDEHISCLGEQDSCGSCHHQNMPFDQNSSCCECHRDMYTPTDIFSHSSHVEKLGGNDGCAACHRDPNRVKSRDTATACAECHAKMVVKDSFIQPNESGLKGHAVGYKGAMHGLCISCHIEYNPDLAECSFCHRNMDATQLRRMGPYVARHQEK